MAKATPISTALVAVALFAASCSKSPEAYPQIPIGVPVPAPETPLQDMKLSEDYSIELEDMLFHHARALEKKDFSWIDDILTVDFQGEAWHSLKDLGVTEGIHSTHHADFDPDSGEVVGGVAFSASMAELFQPWQEISSARWDVYRADFQPGRPTWGQATLTLKVLGLDVKGRPTSLTLDGIAQFVRDRNNWYLRGFDVVALERLNRANPMFTEVTKEVGIGYEPLPREDDDAAFPFRHLRLPYNGAGAGDANGDGIFDIFVSGKERNFLYLGRKDGTFDEAAEAWGLLEPGDGTGSVFFDYDNDGDQDLAVGGEGFLSKDGTPKYNQLRLYRNDGDHYTDVSVDMGMGQYMFSYGLAVVDYDLDGWLDLYVCNYGTFSLFRNNAWDEADNGQADVFFRNMEGKGFKEVSEKANTADPRWSFAAAAADYDRDGDQDIYVVHDFGLNALFGNNGDGTFTDIADRATTMDLGFGMNVSWGDLNNDGLLDLYIANMRTSAGMRVVDRLNRQADGMMAVMKLSRGNTILLQQEDHSFELLPEEKGGIQGDWAWGCLPNDFDLDGRLDVFCTNGYISRNGAGDINSFFWQHVVSSTTDVAMQPTVTFAEEVNSPAYTNGLSAKVKEQRSWSGWEHDKLWINQGEEGFIDVSDVSGANSRGDGRAAIAIDFDDDGDMDIFLNEWSAYEQNVFKMYRNDLHAEPTGFLKIRLEGTRLHPSAIGAEVVVTTPHGPCSQVLSSGTGFLSANPLELHYGLGEAETAEIEVIWPGAIRESFGTVSADSRILLVEGAGKAVPFGQ